MISQRLFEEQLETVHECDSRNCDRDYEHSHLDLFGTDIVLAREDNRVVGVEVVKDDGTACLLEVLRSDIKNMTAEFVALTLMIDGIESQQSKGNIIHVEDSRPVRRLAQ